MTSTATSSPISPGRLNPFHSGQNHFYSHAHGHHHLFSPIMNKRRFNSPIRVDELDFLSHSSYNEESDCGVLLDILRSNSGSSNNNNNNSHSYVSTSPAKGSCMYMTNVNIPHPTNPCPSVAAATTVTTGGIAIPSHGDNGSVTLDSSPLSASTLPLSPIDEEEVEVDFVNQEIQSSPSSPLQQVTSAKYDATLPKKSPTRSLLSTFTPSVEIVVEDTSQMI